MKRTVLFSLLGLSLAGNAALFTVYVRSEQTVAALRESAGTASSSARESAQARAATEAALVEAKAAATQARSEIWKSLQTDDLPALVANLRAAGFPDKTSRAIVASLLAERYAAKRRALLGGDETPAFWKSRSLPIGYDPAKQADLRALGRENSELLKQLFGSDTANEEARIFQQRMYGPLPAEKLDAVGRIHSDYGDLTSQIFAESGGMMLPEDRENLALLEQEKRKDLAALLTPAELEQYDLYSSTTANTLRRNLATFNPSEQEFRAVFALQKEFDDTYRTQFGGMLDEKTQQDRRTAEAKLNEKLRATLGDQRFEEYQRAQDNGYRVAARIAERYKLPAENAVAVYNIQKEAQQKLMSFRGDREAAANYARETSAKLNQLLGAKGVEAFRQSGGGFWIRNLERAATPRG